MIHLKYKCKVNFVKLPLIWIYLCLKLVFENATAGRNTDCRSVVNCALPTHPHLPRIPRKCRVHDPASWFRKTWFTRRRVRELKNAHNSVTVQNRTHVYMNFFHNKDLENHLLQLFPKVVKHRVYRSDSGGKSIFWKMIVSVIVGKESSYERVSNSEWLSRQNCLNLRMQKHCER